MRAPIRDKSEPDERGFVPTAWWRVIDEDGALWCETSSEHQARKAIRPGDRLERLHMRSEQEWRPAT